MSFNIEVLGGKNYLLPTGGKYCPQDIAIAAIGGAGGEHVWSKSLSAADEILEYVTDNDINAYPEEGEQEGFYYVRLSVPLFVPTEDFDFTGTYIIEEKTLDDIEYWMVIFTESGTLTMKKAGLFGDVCVCGGGGGGTSNGNGGHGGFVNNFFTQEIKSGEIVIGAGGGVGAAGGASSYGELTADGALACANTYSSAAIVGGSSGGGSYLAGVSNYNWKCTGQGTTTRPFESTELDPMGAGGGGGGYRNKNNNYLLYIGGGGGSDGGSGYGATYSDSSAGGGGGGNKGGGAGGSYASRNGGAGTYYGAGGGGCGYDTGSRGTSGSGYQGVVMIRIPKRRNKQ